MVKKQEVTYLYTAAELLTVYQNLSNRTKMNFITAHRRCCK